VTYYDEPIDSFEKLEIFAKALYCKVKAVDEEEAKHHYRGLTFLEFLRAIENVCKAAGRQEPELDFHFNRQYPALFAKRGTLPHEIVDVAHLKRPWLELTSVTESRLFQRDSMKPDTCQLALAATSMQHFSDWPAARNRFRERDSYLPRPSPWRGGLTVRTTNVQIFGYAIMG
jgi:hypothetical protein